MIKVLFICHGRICTFIKNPVKSRLYGALPPHTVASVVVKDYGNTTNEGMQTDECRSEVFSGGSNR